jgi:hypothetical protein
VERERGTEHKMEGMEGVGQMEREMEQAETYGERAREQREREMGTEGERERIGFHHLAVQVP